MKNAWRSTLVCETCQPGNERWDAGPPVSLSLILSSSLSLFHSLVLLAMPTKPTKHCLTVQLSVTGINFYTWHFICIIFVHLKMFLVSCCYSNECCSTNDSHFLMWLEAEEVLASAPQLAMSVHQPTSVILVSCQMNSVG